MRFRKDSEIRNHKTKDKEEAINCLWRLPDAFCAVPIGSHIKSHQIIASPLGGYARHVETGISFGMSWLVRRLKILDKTSILGVFRKS